MVISMKARSIIIHRFNDETCKVEATMKNGSDGPETYYDIELDDEMAVRLFCKEHRLQGKWLQVAGGEYINLESGVKTILT